MAEIKTKATKESVTKFLQSIEPKEKLLLEKLGKHKTSVGCLYINKLKDVDEKILIQLIKHSFKFKKKNY